MKSSSYEYDTPTQKVIRGVLNVLKVLVGIFVLRYVLYFLGYTSTIPYLDPLIHTFILEPVRRILPAIQFGI